MQPDTRNPVLALALETLRITENRYSGIPTIRREMEKFHLREPEFADERGSFTVTFYKAGNISKAEPEPEEATIFWYSVEHHVQEKKYVNIWDYLLLLMLFRLMLCRW